VLECVEFFELSAFSPSSSVKIISNRLSQFVRAIEPSSVDVLDRGLLFIAIDELPLAWVKYGRFLGGGTYPL
jgi:hypothetical protein